MACPTPPGSWPPTTPTPWQSPSTTAAYLLPTRSDDRPRRSRSWPGWRRAPTSARRAISWRRGTVRLQHVRSAGDLAKAEMAEMARSEVDEVLLDLKADETRGKVFAKAHIERTQSSTTPRGKGRFGGVSSPGVLAGLLRGSQRSQGQRDPRSHARNPAKVVLLPPEPQGGNDHAGERTEVRKWGHVDPATDPCKL